MKTKPKKKGKSLEPKYCRPDWDEYFINISQEVGKRATCDRGRSGAVIVKDKRILCTGYVGAPVGLKHCDEIGHLYKTVYRADGTKSEHCVRTTHAEMNAIVQAARYGIAIDGATIYCRMTPCLDCAKAIINAGIKRVVCEKKYHAGQDSVDFFKSAGVELKILSDETETYPRM
jgi:dCMP deaminase